MQPELHAHATVVAAAPQDIPNHTSRSAARSAVFASWYSIYLAYHGTFYSASDIAFNYAWTQQLDHTLCCALENNHHITYILAYALDVAESDDDDGKQQTRLKKHLSRPVPQKVNSLWMIIRTIDKMLKENGQLWRIVRCASGANVRQKASASHSAQYACTTHMGAQEFARSDTGKKLTF